MYVFMGLLVLFAGSALGQAQDEECQLDFAFAVDASGSIAVDIGNQTAGDIQWGKVITFLESVINRFDVGPDDTQFGLVRFADLANTHYLLNAFDNKEDTLDRTRELTYPPGGGRTNTQAALERIRDEVFVVANGDRPDVRNVIMILTDGEPTADLNGQLMETADGLKEDDVRILGVGVGITEPAAELAVRALVTDNATDYIAVDDFGRLQESLDQIIAESCRIITDCDNSADVFLVMDGSGSIKRTDFDLMKAFAVNVIDHLNVDTDGVNVGIILFSDDATIMVTLDQFDTREDIRNFIEDPQQFSFPGGATNTEEAIRLVRTQGFGGNGDRPDVPNVVVLLTDGNSNQPSDTYSETVLAKNDGIHMVTVGIGDWTNVMELKIMASYPHNQNYIAVNSFAGLNDNVREAVVALICNNNDDCRNNPCNTGECVDMIGTFVCQCPPGVAGRRCDRTCRDPADVAFALDSSGSVGRDNFLVEMDFVRELVMGLNINSANGEDTCRVASEQYANSATVNFNLDDHTEKMGVLNALSLFYTGGTTNTAAALQTMRNTMFNSGNGDRASAHNVGVVLTDGRSNNFDATWSEARQARANGAQLVAVKIGGGTRDNDLEAIASHPVAANIMDANDFNSLGDIVDSTINAICNNDDDCVNDPCNGNGVCEDLIGGFQCTCDGDFSGRQCDRECGKRYDIILAIDVSGSIRNERLPQVVDFLAEMIMDFEVSDQAARFGAVTFAESSEMEFQLNDFGNVQDVISALKTRVLYRGGRTDITSAFEMISSTMFTGANGDRGDADNFIILVTDGAGNEREDETMQMAIQARVDGANIIGIGVGTDVDHLEMRGMVSQPFSEMLVYAESFTQITANDALRQTVKDLVISASCDDVDECDNAVCQNGGQCIDLLHRYDCNCPTDFSGLNCERRCTRQMDVTFVLDFSGSLDQVSDIVIAFTRAVVQGLPFNLGRARVAVISYHDDATLHFDLNEYSLKEEVLNALSFSRYGGRTNTQAALQTMNDDVFVTGGGDRNGIDNIAIVVTDGGSNILREETIPEANRARSFGTEVYVAAISDAPDNGEVDGIADQPASEHVVFVPDANSVDGAASDLLDLLCNN